MGTTEKNDRYMTLQMCIGSVLGIRRRFEVNGRPVKELEQAWHRETYHAQVLQELLENPESDQRRFGNKDYYTVLGTCLTMVEAMQRRFSHQQGMVQAAPGYEGLWEKERKYAEVIREMMVEARYGKQEQQRMEL